MAVLREPAALGGAARLSVENIVLITIDSLRADSCQESIDNGDAPTIADIHDRGTVFERAIANGPNTPSSFPSILTGTHPLLYGGYRYLDDQKRPFLSATLRDAGFATVGYHSNPHLGPEKNYNAGFDTFNDGREGEQSADTLINFVDSNLSSDSRLYSVLRRVWHTVGSAAGVSAYDQAESITDDAVKWLNGRLRRPFFMWLHYMDVHYPFQPPERDLQAVGHESLSARRTAALNNAMQEDPASLSERDRTDLKALYRGEIHHVDRNVGRLVDTLDRLGLREETVIVLTADHGEAFGEHSRWGHHPYMYDELLRVPLVVDHPDRPSSSIETQVSLIDISPTIYDACGVKQPSALQGQNLYDKTGGIELGTSQGGERLAARTTNWKLLWHVDEETVELYNLRNDPSETTDLSAENAAVVDRLREELEVYREEARSTDTENPTVEESEEVKRRLRDLGYTD